MYMEKFRLRFFVVSIYIYHYDGFMYGLISCRLHLLIVTVMLPLRCCWGDSQHILWDDDDDDDDVILSVSYFPRY